MVEVLDLATAYCKRRGLKLNTELTFRDLGVSAFRGKNAMVGSLGAFLRAVETGMVPRGSVLICESFDRISRQGIDKGYDLVKQILKAGIKIVTLTPEREFTEEATRSLSKGALEIQLILERAAEESERKSERISASWRTKREHARNGGIMTRMMPAWLRERNGKIEVIQERAAVIKKVFRLASSGYGRTLIIKQLAEDGDLAFGRSGRWSRGYIDKILSDKRSIGVLMTKDGPIKAFPPIITEEQWLVARAGSVDRRHRGRGRIGSEVNLFSGLIHDAIDGSSCVARPRKIDGEWRRVLTNVAAIDGQSKYRTFRLDVFETAIMSELRELNPDDVFPPAQPNRVSELTAALAAVTAEIDLLAAELEKGVSPTLMQAVKQREAKKAELERELIEARREAATPYHSAWKAIKPKGEKDRMAVRNALHQLIADIRILVVPIKRESKLAIVQVWFAGGAHRHYILWKGTHEAYRFEELGENLDLREPEQAQRVAEYWKGASAADVDAMMRSED